MDSHVVALTERFARERGCEYRDGSIVGGIDVFWELMTYLEAHPEVWPPPRPPFQPPRGEFRL